MTEKIDLLLWSESPVTRKWGLGEIHYILADNWAAATAISAVLADPEVEYILMWDPALGSPPEERVAELIQEPVDLWHAGLLLGMGGKPEDIDYISPTWTFNRDPDPQRRAISWRLSLRACLVRTEVLRSLGWIDCAFQSLEAAGLELGYRYIWRGPVMVHEPRLVEGCNLTAAAELPVSDRYAFIARHFQPIWLRYVYLRRCLASGSVFYERREMRAALQRIQQVGPAYRPQAAYVRASGRPDGRAALRISALIPTLCRYPYLRETLDCLRQQTLKPDEVICVDQTPLAERQPEVYEQYPDLNIKVIWKDEPGQCSARNAGLEQVSGELVLFLDDDILIPAEYVQNLFDGLRLYDADIANGVWSQGAEQATQPLDRRYRLSDRLATGNSLATLTALRKVGGFDLHYNRNYRADADLGMRLYLSGVISIVTPIAKEHSISPPTGGLKFFGATGGMHKIGLFKPWPATTQTYYWLRYFSQQQMREAFILMFLATAVPQERRYSASRLKKLAYVLVSLLFLPFRLYGAWLSFRDAKPLVTLGPQIPGINN